MLGQPRSRQRAVAYLGAGVGLTVVCVLVLTQVAEKLAEANANPSGAVRLLLAMPALGMAAGLCLVYVGLARIVMGTLVDKVDLKKINGPGLLYVLGFAATLVLAGYIVIGVFHIDPMRMRRF